MARDDDADREAILRRRNRLIALALTGLSSVACGNDPEPAPLPCLDVPAEEARQREAHGPEDPTAPPSPATGRTDDFGRIEGDDDVAPERPPDPGAARPTPCLTPEARPTKNRRILRPLEF